MPHRGYVYSFNLYPTIFSCMFAIEYGYNLVNKKKKKLVLGEVKGVVLFSRTESVAKEVKVFDSQTNNTHIYLPLHT
jgi:hypothetical protein